MSSAASGVALSKKDSVSDGHHRGNCSSNDNESENGSTAHSAFSIENILGKERKANLSPSGKGQREDISRRKLSSVDSAIESDCNNRNDDNKVDTGNMDKRKHVGSFLFRDKRHLGINGSEYQHLSKDASRLMTQHNNNNNVKKTVTTTTATENSLLNRLNPAIASGVGGISKPIHSLQSLVHHYPQNRSAISENTVKQESLPIEDTKRHSPLNNSCNSNNGSIKHTSDSSSNCSSSPSSPAMPGNILGHSLFSTLNNNGSTPLMAGNLARAGGTSFIDPSSAALLSSVYQNIPSGFGPYSSAGIYGGGHPSSMFLSPYSRPDLGPFGRDFHMLRCEYVFVM